MSLVPLRGTQKAITRCRCSSERPHAALRRRSKPYDASSTTLTGGFLAYINHSRSLTSTAYAKAEWRQDSVSAINDRTGRINIDLNDPRSKYGFLQEAHYAEKPTYPRIALDPVPDNASPDKKRNLDSTRPAPLEMITRKPDDSTFSYYYRLGKSYLNFYKTGMKNVWYNWKEFSEIKSWINPFPIQNAARYGGTEQLHLPRFKQTVTCPHIFRREYVLYYRFKHDAWKLLPFSLVLLICGEFTPFAILLLGDSVVPYTCRIPQQQKAAKDAAIKRFDIYLSEMRALTKSTAPLKPAHALDFTPRDFIKEHPWRRDLLFAHLVHQTSFTRLPFFIFAPTYWHVILQRRLQRYFTQIFCETVLIRREGGFAKLSPQDIYEYALNYGSFTLLMIMKREIQRGNYDFVNEDLKQSLVPVLEAEAEVMLDDDFTRLHPKQHWARAYRDSVRWARTKDVEVAGRMMRDVEREKWAAEREVRQKTKEPNDVRPK